MGRNAVEVCGRVSGWVRLRSSSGAAGTKACMVEVVVVGGVAVGDGMDLTEPLLILDPSILPFSHCW